MATAFLSQPEYDSRYTPLTAEIRQLERERDEHLAARNRYLEELKRAQDRIFLLERNQKPQPRGLVGQ